MGVGWAMELNVTALTGAAIDPVLDEVARLRITVFAEFPYLYDGDVEYDLFLMENFVKEMERSHDSFNEGVSDVA